jgi:hypothetical protein
MDKSLGIILLLKYISGQISDYSIIKSNDVQNACSGPSVTVPSKFKMNYQPVFSVFRTGNFSTNSFEKGDISLCNPNCNTNCCNTETCQKILNSNYDALQPDTIYYLIHGGYAIKSGDKVYDYSSPPGSTNPELISSDFYYVSSINARIFYMKVEQSFPIALHRGVIVERIISDTLYHDYYFFGGFSSFCITAWNNCAIMYKVSLPTSTISKDGRKPEVIRIGNVNQSLAGLSGHCLIHDSYRNQLIIYGGMILKNDQFSYSKGLWTYNLESNIWTEIQINSNFTRTFTANNSTYSFEEMEPGPIPRLFHTCKIRHDSLLLIGGLRKNSKNEVVYLRDLWSFNFESRKWSEVKFESFNYDQELDFGYDFYPQLNENLFNDTESYRMLEVMSDFSQFYKTRQSNLKGSFSVARTYPLCQYSMGNDNYFCLTKTTGKSLCNEQNPLFYTNTGSPMKNPCFLNGQCIGGTCQCYKGYFGPDCKYRDCPNSCGLQSNETSFVAFSDFPFPQFNETVSSCLYTYPVSYCSCEYSPRMMAGEDCSKTLCMNDCSSPNGVCNYTTGICTCDPVHFSDDCSMTDIVIDA